MQRSCVATIMHDGVRVSSLIDSSPMLKTGTIQAPFVSSPPLAFLSFCRLHPCPHWAFTSWWTTGGVSSILYKRSYFPETRFITITSDLRPPSSHLTLPAGRYIAVSFYQNAHRRTLSLRYAQGTLFGLRFAFQHK